MESDHRLGCQCKKDQWCLGNLSMNQINNKKKNINSLYYGDDGKLDRRVR